MNEDHDFNADIEKHLDNFDRESEKMEEQAKARFAMAVNKLMLEKNWPKRKAVRYLTKMANKQLKKLVKEGKARQKQLRESGELIDTSDLRTELDQELREQLIAEGIDPNTIDTRPASLFDKDEEYDPPTRDF